MKEEIEKRKKMRGKGMADEEVSFSLPYELIVEILSRLPVKSLFRFKTVCKQWLSLIQSPNFITLHFNQSPTNLNPHPCLCLFLVTKPLATNILIYDLPTFVAEQHHEHEHEHEHDVSTFIVKHALPRDTLAIKAYCNGLLFYNTHNYESLFSFVHNLTTTQQLQIPLLPCRSNPLCGHIEFGLNPHTNNYCCVHLYKSKCYLFPLPADATPSSWRKISTSPLKTCSSYSGYGKCLCINGVMHWNSSSLNIITLFDLKTEEFGIVAYPTNFELKLEYEFQEFKGSLCLFRVDTENVFNLWVLKDCDNHSWDYHRFVLPHSSPFTFKKHPGRKISIVGNGDIVRISHKHDHPYFLHSYNLYTGVCKKIELSGIPSNMVKFAGVVAVGDYKENMIALTSG